MHLDKTSLFENRRRGENVNFSTVHHDGPGLALRPLKMDRVSRTPVVFSFVAIHLGSDMACC